jgi:putative endonuclease
VSDTKATGNRGEAVARHYLERKGYEFIAANWAGKVGEIDLIMNDGTERVLVEVRLRRPTSFGAGFDTVAWQKQQKLIRIAKFYQQKERYWGDLRFDVVSITDYPDREPEIEHIENAFSVG